MQRITAPSTSACDEDSRKGVSGLNGLLPKTFFEKLLTVIVAVTYIWNDYSFMPEFPM